MVSADDGDGLAGAVGARSDLADTVGGADLGGVVGDHTGGRA